MPSIQGAGWVPRLSILWPKLAGAVCFHVQLEDTSHLQCRDQEACSPNVLLCTPNCICISDWVYSVSPGPTIQPSTEGPEVTAPGDKGIRSQGWEAKGTIWKVKFKGAGGRTTCWRERSGMDSSGPLEARDSAWGWSTQPRGLWLQRKENYSACWIGHVEDVVFKLILEGQVWCDRCEQGWESQSQDSHRTVSSPEGWVSPSAHLLQSCHPHTSEKTCHPPGHWRAEEQCGESRKNKRRAAWTTQRLSNSVGIRISQEAG